MTSLPSDCESNISGYVSYSDVNVKKLYKSAKESLELINQGVLQIEINMKHIVSKAGPLENQLNVILQSLPTPSISMETD